MKGKAIWILGFFTFLSALNAFTAVVLSINLGIEANFQPYLIDTLTGAIPVYAYLVASIIATLAFLALTAHKVITELSNKELLYEINQRTGILEDGQSLLKANQENIKSNIFLTHKNIDQTKTQITNNLAEQQKTIKKSTSDLTKTMEYESTNITTKIGKNLKKDFRAQEENLAQLHNSLNTKLETETTNAKVELSNQLQDLISILQASEKRAKQNTKDLTKQKNQITDIQEKISQIEQQFVIPKTQLASTSSPEQIRGIGPNTNNELKKMGITTLGDLILANPQVIAKKTSLSNKMATKLQGIAQLSLVPSLKEKDIIILEEIGITNQQELSHQDPIEMGRNINKVLKGLIKSGKILEEDKPTIEEIHSWIKYAKT